MSSGSIWRAVHHYSTSLRLRAELLSELARARRLGIPLPPRIGSRAWKEPHRWDDFVRFLRFLDPRKQIQVFDVGANTGNWTTDLLEFFPHAAVTCLEPVPATFQKLRSRFAGDSRVCALNAAASSKDGTAEMEVDEHSERSTLHHYAETQKDLDIKIVDKAQVQLLRLDSLSLLESADARLLKLDVQGHEMEAMAGAAGVLCNVDVLIVEVSFMLEYEGLRPSFSRVCRLAEEADLLPAHFREHGRKLSPYAWERDVIFVRQRLLDRLWGW